MLRRCRPAGRAVRPQAQAAANAELREALAKLRFEKAFLEAKLRVMETMAAGDTPVELPAGFALEQNAGEASTEARPSLEAPAETQDPLPWQVIGGGKKKSSGKR